MSTEKKIQDPASFQHHTYRDLIALHFRNCIVIDGMGFVNQLAMKNMVTLADLKSQFTERLKRETEHQSFIILVFDSYNDSLNMLKQQTWDSRHKVQVQYKLSSSTIIKDISLKELLSHPANKRYLTQYFAEKMPTRHMS